MVVLQLITQLCTSLWALKVMYDQHAENGNESKELLNFIQDYDRLIPLLRKRFQEGGGNGTGIVAIENLEKDVTEAINMLETWFKNKSSFDMFNSAELVKKIGELRGKVMASVHKGLGIANVSLLLEVHASQAQLKSLLDDVLASQAKLESLLNRMFYLAFIYCLFLFLNK